MRSNNAVAALLLFGLSVLLGACLPWGQAESDGRHPGAIADMRVGALRHDLVLTANQQGPAVPCVGISLVGLGGSRTSVACPIEEAEVGAYVAVIEFPTGSFVVGYELEDGEEITAEVAIQVVVGQGPDGRRYFMIELDPERETNPTELLVTAPSGATRTITLAS